MLIKYATELVKLVPKKAFYNLKEYGYEKKRTRRFQKNRKKNLFPIPIYLSRNQKDIDRDGIEFLKESIKKTITQVGAVKVTIPKKCMKMNLILSFAED